MSGAVESAKKATPENRYRLFAKAYTVDFNATKAAIAAGYSKKTAHAAGWRLLQHVKVKQLLSQIVTKRVEKLDLNGDMVISELQKLGFSNMMDYIRIENGDAYVDLSQMTRDQAAAIGELTSETFVDHYEGTGDDRKPVMVKRTKFKLVDKTKNLELLGRHLKLFHESETNRNTFNFVFTEKERQEAINITAKLLEE